jgi:carboxylate-amine ligase
VHQILKNGTGAAKQLFWKDNDLTKVVDFITGEFTKGL